MRKMNDKEKRAWNLYMEGLTYREISQEIGMSEHTLRSWQKKFKWNRNITIPQGYENTPKKGKVLKKNTDKFNEIRGGLLEELESKGNAKPHFIDMINDYMSYWVIKNELLEDIEKRGVQVAYKNGQNQFGTKKNDSLDSAIKYNVQMLAILDKLDLKAEEGDDLDDVEL